MKKIFIFIILLSITFLSMPSPSLASPPPLEGSVQYRLKISNIIISPNISNVINVVLNEKDMPVISFKTGQETNSVILNAYDDKPVLKLNNNTVSTLADVCNNLGINNWTSVGYCNSDSLKPIQIDIRRFKPEYPLIIADLLRFLNQNKDSKIVNKTGYPDTIVISGILNNKEEFNIRLETVAQPYIVGGEDGYRDISDFKANLYQYKIFYILVIIIVIACIVLIARIYSKRKRRNRKLSEKF